MTEAPDTSQNTGANGHENGTSATPADETALKMSELETAIKEKENKYLYLYAEFENYKKRSIKERSDLLKFAWEPVARDLLDVLDNMERALQHIPAGTDASFISGLEMIRQQFRSALEKQGVQVIQTEKKTFDPTLHEAVGQAPSDQPAGSIIHEEIRGYTLHGRLLRPSRVILSTGPAQT